MSGSKTNWLEQQLLNWWFGHAAAPTAPATWYFALSTVAFDEAATGSAMNEVSSSGTAYVRVAVTNNTTNFPASTPGDPSTSENGASISWPVATADWGNIASVYLCDALTGGNAWFGGDVAIPTEILSGMAANIPIGGMVANEN